MVIAIPPAQGQGAPANDNYVNWIRVIDTPYSNTQSTIGATLEAGEPRPCGFIGSTVWYFYHPSKTGMATVQTLSSGYDTVLAGYQNTGEGFGGLSLLACNDDYSGSLQSSISFRVDAYQGYNIQIGGFNGAVGTLVLSIELTVVQPPGPPTLNSATPGVGTVSLAWSPPASDGGAPISGYNVYRSGCAGCAKTQLLTTTATTWTDTGVSHGTTYCYDVAAGNGFGLGAHSNELCAITPAPPGAPELVSATPGNRQVSLSWSPPPSDGGTPITGYKVLRAPCPGCAGSQIAATTATSWVDTSLTNGQLYCYKVTAGNAVGDGDPSNQRCATPDIPPAAPTGVSALPGALGQIKVRWQAPPSNGGSAPMAYRIYRNDGDGFFMRATVGGGFLEFSDPDLTFAKTYRYYVSAVNGAGEGSPSTVVCTKPGPWLPLSNPVMCSLP